MIYAIEAVGLGMVKLGKAKRPAEMLDVLKTGCPVPLKLIAAVPWHDSNERLIHECFAGERRCGEWFEASYRVTEFVNVMACPNADEQTKFSMAMVMLKEANNGRTSRDQT